MSETTKAPGGRFGWLRTTILGTVIAGVSLFWPAGRLDWVMGWVVVALYLVWDGATSLIVMRTNPDLLVERTSRRKDAKRWDVIIMSIIGVLTLAKHVIAGFDLRHTWTTTIPVAAQIVAAVIAILAYTWVSWAMVSNAFFSKIVRIQEDRGHTVATGGPYKYVRHPAYIGTFIFELVTPIMLGSFWALIPGALSSLLFVVRTALEDRDLKNELPGYREYAEKVRYRLLPGIW